MLTQERKTELIDIISNALSELIPAESECNSLPEKQPDEDIPVEMQSICKRAVEQGIIENTPCHNVVLPKTEQKYKTCTFSIEDVKEFIQIIDNSRAKSDFKRIIKILLFTGMRIGELLALEWDDIDFAERTISISHTLLIIKGEFIRSTTKTVKSTRVITMNNTVYNLLIEQLKYTEELKKALGQKCMHPDAVFISDKGNYKNRNLIGATLKIVTAKTRFKDVTPHSLRHWFASILLDLGVNLKYISDSLGHTSINITANIYADSLNNAKVLIADKMEEVLL